MATVIDHVLIELQLDPSKFDAAIKKSAEAWMKLRQQAEQGHKDTNEPVEAMTKAFGTLATKVLAFGAALLSVQRIVSFGVNIVRTNIEIGNLSKTTQISVETLSKWALAAERYGSSAQSMFQAIEGMDTQLKKLQATGNGGALTALITELERLGGVGIVKRPDANTTAEEMYLEIFKAMDKLGMDKRQRQTVFEEFGFVDRSVQGIFSEGAAFMRKIVEEQDGIYKASQKNIDISLELNKAWAELEQRATSLGQIIMEDLFRPIKTVIDAMSFATMGATERAKGQQPQSRGGALFMPPTWAMPKGGPDNSGGKGVYQYNESNKPWWGHFDPSLFPNQPDGDVNLPKGAKPRSFSRESMTLPGGGETHRGAASFYTGLPSEGGNRTSTGEMVRPDTYTGALQTDLARKYGGLRKGGVWADVIDDKTGKRVRVFLNDTGPLRPGRMVDLSPKAFQEFGPLSKGVIPNLRMEMLPAAPAGKPYKGGPVQDNPFDHGAPPIPWLSNPRLLRSSRFNQMLNPTQNYATSEMTVHSLIVNSKDKPVTDDAYGLSVDAIPALERGNYMTQMTEGPL